MAEIIDPFVTISVQTGNLTKEEFINIMMENVPKAINKYNEMAASYVEAERQRLYDMELELINNAAEARNYKRESAKLKFIEAQKAKMRPVTVYGYNISSFSFKFRPWAIETSAYERIGLNDLTPERLSDIFDFVKDNEYWKAGLGLQFCINHNEKMRICSCIPNPIKLILPTELEQQFTQDCDRLCESVANFYKDTKYWGD